MGEAKQWKRAETIRITQTDLLFSQLKLIMRNVSGASCFQIDVLHSYFCFQIEVSLLSEANNRAHRPTWASLIASNCHEFYTIEIRGGK